MRMERKLAIGGELRGWRELPWVAREGKSQRRLGTLEVYTKMVNSETKCSNAKKNHPIILAVFAVQHVWSGMPYIPFDDIVTHILLRLDPPQLL